MDFMFEDDVDEVGSDVEAYCPKCKTDTTHVVISKYEDEIRRVQCNPCGDVHSFRKPRGEAEEDMPEPVAARKRALLKKQTWEEFFAKHGEKNAKPYEFRETYRENLIVFHPKFGKGYVSEVVSESKVEITFADTEGTLVGFRFPPTASSINVPGWHFHYISADRTLGGHVFDLTTGPTHASIQELSELRILFPAQAPSEAISDAASIKAAE